jgi:hypothetical protein
MTYPGGCEARPGDWEALCADVRPIILSDLSLRELAYAAPTCHEFQRENRSRLVEEWARLISVGQKTYGKATFSSFVKAMRQLTVSRDGFPGLSRGNHLIINAAGETELMSSEEMRQREQADKDEPFGWIEQFAHPRPVTYAHLVGARGNLDIFSDMFFVLYYKGEGVVDLEVDVLSQEHEAVMGSLLAICAGNPVTWPTCLGNPVAGPACVGIPMAGPACVGNPVTGPECGGNPVAGPVCVGNPVAGPACVGNPVAGPACAGNPVAGPACAGNPVAVPGCGGNPVAWPACAGNPVAGPACVGNPGGVPACAGNPVAAPACAVNRPGTINVYFTEFSGNVGMRAAEDLVGPLTSLAESCVFCWGSQSASPPALGQKGYPLGHLRVYINGRYSG